jgi:DNA-binding protein H-NS
MQLRCMSWPADVAVSELKFHSAFCNRRALIRNSSESCDRFQRPGEEEDMATYKELLSQIEQLKAEAAEARATEVTTGIAEIKQRMAELGITIDDLTGGSRSLRRRAVVASVVKYRNPQTGQTWSGKGRRPAWIVSADDPEVFHA